MNKKFKRLDNWKYKRFKNKPKWRKSRGPKSPWRRVKSGRPAVPTVGFRKPIDQRGLHPSGLKEVRVHNPDQIAKLDSKTEIARISGTVGARKRAEMVKVAQEKQIRVIGNANTKKASSKSA
ncbi:MAG: 50S ribosomal protein L32e [Candidatus Altiarchaeota archaeon]|nr:50S ribosomal protein L32e [Candidatus Altiarchaeota archaeon]